MTRDSVAVLVGAVVHPVSGRSVRSRSDAIATGLGLGLPLPLRLLSAGPLPESVARDYLALGAPAIDIFEREDVGVGDKDGEPALPGALLPALHSVRWVLTGTRSAAERGTGWLPHALAVALRRPLLTEVCAIEVEDSALVVVQGLPKGARRRLRVREPAVLAISAAAPFQPRHSLAAAIAGRITRTAAPEAAVATPRGQRVGALVQRRPLEARSMQGGRSRLASAIESPSGGGSVVQSGSVESKARVLLDYLRRHSLVSF